MATSIWQEHHCYKDIQIYSKKLFGFQNYTVVGSQNFYWNVWQTSFKYFS